MSAKKPSKKASMKALRCELPPKAAKPVAKKAEAKRMTFTEWLEHYVKQSKGNPV